jgi:pyruvate ferredoxin oxidoreductase beta subunit
MKTILQNRKRPKRRFKHLFEPGNEELLKKVREEVDAEWEKLKREAKTD